jgi:hypothetical protein
MTGVCHDRGCHDRGCHDRGDVPCLQRLATDDNLAVHLSHGYVPRRPTCPLHAHTTHACGRRARRGAHLLHDILEARTLRRTEAEGAAPCQHCRITDGSQTDHRRGGVGARTGRTHRQNAPTGALPTKSLHKIRACPGLRAQPAYARISQTRADQTDARGSDRRRGGGGHAPDDLLAKKAQANATAAHPCWLTAAK